MYQTTSKYVQTSIQNNRQCVSDGLDYNIGLVCVFGFVQKVHPSMGRADQEDHLSLLEIY